MGGGRHGDPGTAGMACHGKLHHRAEGGARVAHHQPRNQGRVQRLHCAARPCGSHPGGAGQPRRGRNCAGACGGGRRPREEGRRADTPEQRQPEPADSECRKRAGGEAEHAAQHADYHGAGPSEQQLRGVAALAGRGGEATPLEAPGEAPRRTPHPTGRLVAGQGRL